MSNITVVTSTAQVDVSKFSDERKDFEGINLVRHLQVNILKAFQYINLYFECVDKGVVTPRPKKKEKLLEYHLGMFEDLDFEIIKEKSKAETKVTHCEEEVMLKGLQTSDFMKNEILTIEGEKEEKSKAILALEAKLQSSRNFKIKRKIVVQIDEKKEAEIKIHARQKTLQSGLKALASSFPEAWASFEVRHKREMGLRKLLPYLDKLESARKLFQEYQGTFNFFSDKYGTSKQFTVSHVSSKKIELNITSLFAHLQKFKEMENNGFSMNDFEARETEYLRKKQIAKENVEINYQLGLKLFLPDLYKIHEVNSNETFDAGGEL